MDEKPVDNPLNYPYNIASPTENLAELPPIQDPASIPPERKEDEKKITLPEVKYLPKPLLIFLGFIAFLFLATVIYFVVLQFT